MIGHRLDTPRPPPGSAAGRRGPAPRCRPGPCPRGRVRLQHQGLDPAPQLVLVGLAPDPAHLGPGVPLDHASHPAARLCRSQPAGQRQASTARPPASAPAAVTHRQLRLERDRRPERGRGQREHRGGQPGRSGPSRSSRPLPRSPARNRAAPPASAIARPGPGPGLGRVPDRQPHARGHRHDAEQQRDVRVEIARTGPARGRWPLAAAVKARSARSWSPAAKYDPPQARGQREPEHGRGHDPARSSWRVCPLLGADAGDHRLAERDQHQRPVPLGEVRGAQLEQVPGPHDQRRAELHGQGGGPQRVDRERCRPPGSRPQ